MIGFGATVRLVRTVRGMSQRTLSERVGKKRGWASTIESGKSEPTLTTINAVAEALDVAPEELIRLSRLESTDAVMEKLTGIP